jgi:hypothetical protein
MKSKLGSVLKNYEINSWDYHDDNNRFSVDLIDIEKMPNIKKYKSWISGNVLTIVCDVKKEFDKAVRDIQDFVIKNKLEINNFRCLVAQLDKVSYDFQRYFYQKSDLAIKRLEEIKKRGFLVDVDWIMWNEFIPINSIFYNNNMILLDSEELRKRNYGIESFKIVNTDLILGGIYCSGIHPNVNINGLYCCEDWVRGSDATVDNLVMLKNSFQCANLDHPYEPKKHLEFFKSFVDQQNAKGCKKNEKRKRSLREVG